MRGEIYDRIGGEYGEVGGARGWGD